jgi:hypothetical protein
MECINITFPVGVPSENGITGHQLGIVENIGRVETGIVAVS